MFQAIGVLRGEVTFDEQDRGWVKVKNTTYPLIHCPKFYNTFHCLRNQPQKEYKLIVYPRTAHFPQKDQPHALNFQLVAFGDRDSNEGLFGKLAESEFYLRGIWQFIPVCRSPCITVYRNYSQGRKEFLKEANSRSKITFFRSIHIPLLWKDAPKPYKFSPKKKDSPKFVAVKARFLPHKGVFGFKEQLEDFQDPPSYLKISPKERGKILKEQLKAK
jgi:hypothetical protein